MNDDEDRAKFFLWVDEIVNTMKGLDETIKESTIVKKVFRSLLVKFNPKVSAIEKMSNIETLTMNQFLGSLTTN